jgi:hypothetical protein
MSAAAHLNHHRTVFVSGLPEAVTRDVLLGAFIPFGDIVELRTRRPSCWGVTSVICRCCTDSCCCLDDRGRRAFVVFMFPTLFFEALTVLPLSLSLLMCLE